MEHENLLKKYLRENKLNPVDLSQLLRCNSGCVYKWVDGKGRPSHKNAWKLHKKSKGAIPISYWGYAIINGKMKRMDKEGLTEDGFKREEGNGVCVRD